MAKSKITSGLMADAVLGGNGDACHIGASQGTYTAAILAIEKHLDAMAKLIDGGPVASLNVEVGAIVKIANDLCRLALEPHSGVPMIGINEVVQNAQKLNSICRTLTAIPKNGSKEFATKRLEELNGLLGLLKRFVKPAP